MWLERSFTGSTNGVWHRYSWLCSGYSMDGQELLGKTYRSALMFISCGIGDVKFCRNAIIIRELSIEIVQSFIRTEVFLLLWWSSFATPLSSVADFLMIRYLRCSSRPLKLNHQVAQFLLVHQYPTTFLYFSELVMFLTSYSCTFSKKVQ